MPKPSLIVDEPKPANAHFWIGRGPCGCIVAFCPDEPEYGKEVGKWIKDGRKVERVPIADAKKYPIGHFCRPAEGVKA
jgi:hypothetical protein